MVDHYYQSLVGWFDFQKVYDLAIREANDGDVFVEIGTANGQSAAYMAVEIENSGKVIDFVTVDIFPPENEQWHQEANVREHLRKFQFVSVVKNNSIKFLGNIPDNSVKFIFLDGAHDYETISKELDIAWRKLKPGGIIGGHDYMNKGYPDVSKAVDEFMADNNIEYEIIGISFIARKKWD